MLLWTLPFSSGLAAAEPAELVHVERIWDKAPHNAFTDLLYHNDTWFCVFREGTRHVSPDGKLRIIASSDGRNWESAALIESDDADLRDAKITVAADGRLMLSGAAALHDQAKGTHQSFAWYSADGRDWSEAIPIGDRNYWLWRVTWHDGHAYSVGYLTKHDGNGATRLYESADGRDFSTHVSTLLSGNRPNESSLLFLTDDAMACLTRREGPDNTALIGISPPPYKEWKWRDLGVRIGGPQILRLKDGRLIVGGRRYDGGARTQLWWLDVKTGELREMLTLPSGGDTSYPGFVEKDGLLWVSYYSSHEGKTSIYLAQVQLPAVNAQAESGK